jgi:alkanesulfonate monooxygenase SsuD/methylene tetrahydromethanopterin reductase-like flavin-dependent oxidoreductase (luciferase family)
MKVDGGLGTNLNHAGQQARDLEAAGYSGAWTAETNHDPFLPLALAAEHSSEL